MEITSLNKFFGKKDAPLTVLNTGMKTYVQCLELQFSLKGIIMKSKRITRA